MNNQEKKHEIFMRLREQNKFDVYKEPKLKWWIVSLEWFLSKYDVKKWINYKAYARIYDFLVKIKNNLPNWFSDPIVYMAYLYYFKKLNNTQIIETLWVEWLYVKPRYLSSNLFLNIFWWKLNPLVNKWPNAKWNVNNNWVQKQKDIIKNDIDTVLQFYRKLGSRTGIEFDKKLFDWIDSQEEKTIYLLSYLLCLKQTSVFEFLNDLLIQHVSYKIIASELNIFLDNNGCSPLISITEEALRNIVIKYKDKLGK